MAGRDPGMAPPIQRVVPAGALQDLIAVLRKDGRTVVGPIARDGVVVLDEVRDIAQLPAGIRDEQAPGSYRLADAGDPRFFGFTHGAQSWKSFLLPPRSVIFDARKTPAGFVATKAIQPAARYAFLGVRGCDLRSIAVLDRVFAEGSFPDPTYARRRDVFLVAVTCARPAATCFCVSMGTGPDVRGGFDLALTELVSADGHELLLEAGTERGAAALGALDGRPPYPADLARAKTVVADAVGRITRSVAVSGLAEALAAAPDHPRWDAVAERCLACASCTMVCPTCFCTTVEDSTSPDGREASRSRRWDSCFTADFSYLHGGSVRRSIRSRYRQWLTHKLGTWQAQFGVDGCVGCGRCITWCPAAIDITEEAAALCRPEGAR